VYIGWCAEDGKAPLDVWRTGGEWTLTWRSLRVIVTPPSVVRRFELRRNGSRLRVVA
jgi:hypothetical protein